MKIKHWQNQVLVHVDNNTEMNGMLPLSSRRQGLKNKLEFQRD